MHSRREFLARVAAVLAGLAGFPAEAESQLPGEVRYEVRSGDTLSQIARTHGTTVERIRSRNNLRSDRIVVGQVLILPLRSGTGAIPAEMRQVVAATQSIRVTPGRWKYIVGHHSAIEQGNARAYDAAHRRRGMEHGLAYHFVIGNGRDSGDGEIEIGNRWLRQIHGGHVRNRTYNEHGIGICLVGNFENRRPSERQLGSFTALVDWLRGAAPLGTRPAFTVHRWVDRNHTVCPGRHFPYAAFKKRYGS